jgi:F-box-like
MLTSLPSDILLLIFDHLPVGSLLSLRATSIALVRIITSQLFSHVHLSPASSINTSNGHRNLQCLRSLSSPLSTIAPYITSVHIASRQAKRYFRPEDASTCKLPVRTVISPQHLTPCISKLRNLKTVR